MICPQCQKIIAEGSTKCPFCGVQFSAPPQGQAQAGAGIPQGQYPPQQPYAPYPQGQYPPQQPYAPYPPPPLTPAQKYQTLGGLLQFLVVVWKFVLPILSGLLLLYALVVSFSGILNSESISWEGLKPLLSTDITVLLLAANAVLYCITAIKIERRKASFLAFWQLSVIVLSALETGATLMFSGGLFAALELGTNVVLFFIWNLYFTKSVRVRIYMGSDAYLRTSIFNKKTPAPAPERPKSEKTKVILLVAALLLVYFVLAGCSVYFTFKENAPSLKDAIEAREQVNEFTDELTGATFTIPKGLKENKELAGDRYSLVLESAHDNFEFCAFASHDMFEEIDEADRQGIKRADMNNEMFTRKEIEDWLTEDAGESISDIKTTVERIGKYEYYVVSFRQDDADGFTGEVVNFVHYYNGYEYVFHYETRFTQFSMNAVKEWIASTTIPGEAPLPGTQKK